MARVTTLRKGMRHSSRRGAALVELAILLSLLVFLVLGCIDFGRFVYTYIIVTNAAREGAYVGSSNSYTSSTQAAWEQQVRDSVVAEMQGLGNFDENNLQMSSQPSVDEDGQRRIRVQVGYPFDMVVPWPGLPGSLMLLRAVEMRSIR